MAALATVLEQALKLSDEDRSELVARLLRSLERGTEPVLTEDEWRTAWALELDRRLREVRDGSVKLIDGDDVFRKARERVASHRR